MLHRAAGAIVLHPRSRPRAPCPHAHTLATPGLVRHPRRVRVAPPVCPCAAHVHTSYMPSTMHTPARQVSAALSRDAQGCSSVGPGARGAAAGNTGCRGCRRHSQRASARHARHHAAYTRTYVHTYMHTCMQVRDMQGMAALRRLAATLGAPHLVAPTRGLFLSMPCQVSKQIEYALN